MTYSNLLEVAEAVHDGRVKYLTSFPEDGLSNEQEAVLMDYSPDLCFMGSGMDGDAHRMWFCLFVWEEMKLEAMK